MEHERTLSNGRKNPPARSEGDLDIRKEMGFLCSIKQPNLP